MHPKVKKYLRGRAHDLKPCILVGKEGLTEGLLTEIERTAESVELLKVKVLNNAPAETREIAAQLDEKLRGVVVGTVGHTIIYFLPGKEGSHFLTPDLKIPPRFRKHEAEGEE